MMAMAEEKKDEEVVIGDGLYSYNHDLRILEMSGERHRVSNWDSIITRRKRYGRTSDYTKKYFAKETTFVLPNEFLS